MLQLDVQFLALVASVIIPALVGVIAKCDAEKWFKAALNGLLSFAAAAASIAIAAQGQVRVRDWLMQAIITYGTSELAYQRLYKPTGASDFIEESLSGGIGPRKAPEPAPTSTTQVHEVVFPPAPRPEPAAPITMSPEPETWVEARLRTDEGNQPRSDLAASEERIEAPGVKPPRKWAPARPKTGE